MSCSECIGRLREVCFREGCHVKLREMRHETIVGLERADEMRAYVAQLATGSVAVSLTAAESADLDLQVKRLDVESGDILVVRTAKKLTAAQADAVDAQVSQLARRHGVRDVSVVVLDNATDLTVERPGPVDTRMQHQVPRPAPIVTR